MKKTLVYLVSLLLALTVAAGGSDMSVLAQSAVSPTTPVLTRADCTAASGKPRVEWNAVEKAVKYQVYRSEAVDGKYIKVGSPTKTGATDSTAEAGATYYYKVRSVLPDGKYSRFCQPVEITCRPGRTEITVTADAATGSFVISWDAADGAASYQVYRAIGDGQFSRLKTVSGLSVSDSSAVPGQVCRYKVRAVSPNGVTGAFSSKIVSKTAKCGRPSVTASNVKATGKPRVKWEAVNGAVKYQVYRASTPTGSFSRIGNPTSLGQTDSGAQAGKTYYYKVRAVDASGATGAFSEVIAIKCVDKTSGDIILPVISVD